MNKLNRLIRKLDSKHSFKVKNVVLENDKQEHKWMNGNNNSTANINNNCYDEKTHKMSNGKWSSRISNDSAFCSTETGIIESFGPIDDVEYTRDHEPSNLSFNIEDTRVHSINISKSNEELSQCRLSIDGSSCASLPCHHLGNSLLSVSETKKTSLENIFSSSTQHRKFKRSTSFDGEEHSTNISFRRKIKNITKKSKIRTDISPSSIASNELDAYQIWATKHFVEGKEFDFQIKPADIFLKTRLLKEIETNSDFKVAIVIPNKVETWDVPKNEYVKCLLKSKVHTNSKPMHMFLFENFLIIAKQRFLGMSQIFRIKERLPLLVVWINQVQPNLTIPTQSTLTLGWAHQQIKLISVTFDSLQDKQSWITVFNDQQEIISRIYDKVVIKIYCDDNDCGKRTKKLVVRRNETIDDVMKKVPDEFFPTTFKELSYQFSLKYVGDLNKYLLTGTENLFAIQLASNTNWLNNEVDYFSIVPIKSGGFLKKSHSRKRSKRLTAPIKSDNNSIFGQNLHDMFLMHKGELPQVLLKLLNHLYEYGPKVDGIFRKSSSQKEVQNALEFMESHNELISEMKPVLASSLLKTWLKNMPDSLLIANNYNKWLKAMETGQDRIQKIKTLVNELPRENKIVLNYLVRVLHRIADDSEVNKMTPHNLAVCLGPSILSPSTITDYETEADSRKIANVVIETMIDHAEEIFDDQFIIDFTETKKNKSEGFHEISSFLETVDNYLINDIQISPEGKIHEEPKDITNEDSILSVQRTNHPSNVKEAQTIQDQTNINLSNATEKRLSFIAHSQNKARHYETSGCLDETSEHHIITRQESKPIEKHKSISIKNSLLDPPDYCQNNAKLQPKIYPNKPHRRHSTLPDTKNFQLHSPNNGNKGKPCYIVEVFINSDDGSESSHKIKYRQSIKTTYPKCIDNQKKTISSPSDNSKSQGIGFTTTIYLGPNKTSTIHEPPRDTFQDMKSTPNLYLTTDNKSAYQHIFKQKSPHIKIQ